MNRLPVAAFVLLLAISCAASEPTAYYAPDSAKQQVADAFSQAKSSHHRVIIFYEGKWCNTCAQFRSVSEDKDNVALLKRAFVAVRINVEDDAAFAEFAKSHHIDLKKANPVIAVLEPDGTALQISSVRPAKERFTADGFYKVFSRWELLDPADKVFQQGLANLNGKLAFVEFRADWCGWCHRMEHLFKESSAAPILARYYTMLPVDYDRNEGAHALIKQLGGPEESGLPWFAIVGADGKPLADSNGPKGNIGYPSEDFEIEHFLNMVRKTAPGISRGDLMTIQLALSPTKDAH